MAYQSAASVADPFGLLPAITSRYGSSSPHPQNPAQVVDDQSTVRSMEDDTAKTVAATNLRFRVKCNEGDVERQLMKRMQILMRLQLPDFKPVSEAQLEDWADAAAVIVTKNQLCVSLFQDAWAAVAPPSLARHIGSIPVCEEHEQLVDQVAAILFKSPTYIRAFEVSLLTPQRAASTFDAKVALEDGIARYSRLCKRWSHPFHLPDIRCIELALQSIPPVLEEDIRAFYEQPTWDQLWRRAAGREERILLNRQVLVSLPGFHNPLLPSDVDMRNQRSVPPPPGKRRPPAPCPICEGDHWKSHCPQKPLPRCFKCGQVGHKSPHCPNIAVKDDRGRVDLLVEPKPSQTVIHQRKDRTQTDRMLTAEGTLQALRQVAQQKSTTSKERRSTKRKAEGKPVREKIQHPVALGRLQPPDSESEGSDREEDNVSDGMDNLQLLSLAASALSEQVVTFPAIVNNHGHSVIADTGAARALVSRQLADQLGLVPNDQGIPRQFAGLGDLQGFPTHPVSVTIGDCTRPITFFIVNKPDLPLLIGKSDLAQFNVFVDPVTSSLVNRDTLAIVAVGVEAQILQPTPQPEIDPITQKRLGATDQELFEDGKQTIFNKMKHLPPDLQQRVWELFAKHKDVWLRPRPGAVKGHKARYHYEGPVIKQRQRYLAPELEGEFRKQTAAMIEAGVLEPSKSSFASVPVFVSKKDGGWRLCLDYRQVNKHIKPDRYPIPRLWDCVLKAAHHNFYCTLDINWGFWSLPLEDESKEITAILTPYGLMQFTVAPFGIRNSPPEFQRMIDAVFGNISKVQKYSDDSVLHTFTIAEMVESLEEVLKRGDESGLLN